MSLRTFVAALAVVASAQVAMGAVLTITLPGGAEADDSNYGLSFKPLATGADGFTTYEIVDVPKTPTSDEVPYTVTAAIAATAAVIEMAGDVGTYTQSCGWGAEPTATCVIVAAVADESGSIVTTATSTQTIEAAPITITVPDSGAAASGSPSASASGSAASITPKPSNSGSGSGAGSPSASNSGSGAAAPTGTSSGASKTVVGWSALFMSAMLGACFL